MKRPEKSIGILLGAITLFSSLNAQAKCAPDYTVGLRPMVMAFASTKANKWVKTDKCLKNLWVYVSKNNLKTELYNTALTTIHNAFQVGAHEFATSQCSMELLMMLEENEVEENSLLERIEDDLRRCIAPTAKESEERGEEMSDDYESPFSPQ